KGPRRNGPPRGVPLSRRGGSYVLSRIISLRRRAAAKLKRSIGMGAVAVGSMVMLRLFVVQGVVMRSSSMNPTLLAGDIVLVNRAATGTMVPVLRMPIPG